jgi:hypothetical protein
MQKASMSLRVIGRVFSSHDISCMVERTAPTSLVPPPDAIVVMWLTPLQGEGQKGMCSQLYGTKSEHTRMPAHFRTSSAVNQPLDVSSAPHRRQA